jgi:hypothetical protein
VRVRGGRETSLEIEFIGDVEHQGDGVRVGPSSIRLRSTRTGSFLRPDGGR